MKKNSVSRLLSCVLVVVLIAATALCGIGCAETAVSAETAAEVQTLGAAFTFQVVDRDGNETWYLIHTDEDTVGAALLAYGLIDGEESDYGLYVKQVLGITADYAVDGKYWAFYINGEYAMTGVDSTEVTDGAVYTFKVE